MSNVPFLLFPKIKLESLINITHLQSSFTCFKNLTNLRYSYYFFIYSKTKPGWQTVHASETPATQYSRGLHMLLAAGSIPAIKFFSINPKNSFYTALCNFIWFQLVNLYCFKLPFYFDAFLSIFLIILHHALTWSIPFFLFRFLLFFDLNPCSPQFFQ